MIEPIEPSTIEDDDNWYDEDLEPDEDEEWDPWE